MAPQLRKVNRPFNPKNSSTPRVPQSDIRGFLMASSTTETVNEQITTHSLKRPLVGDRPSRTPAKKLKAETVDQDLDNVDVVPGLEDEADSSDEINIKDHLERDSAVDLKSPSVEAQGSQTHRPPPAGYPEVWARVSHRTQSFVVLLKNRYRIVRIWWNPWIISANDKAVSRRRTAFLEDCCWPTTMASGLTWMASLFLLEREYDIWFMFASANSFLSGGGMEAVKVGGKTIMKQAKDQKSSGPAVEAFKANKRNFIACPIILSIQDPRIGGTICVFANANTRP